MDDARALTTPLSNAEHATILVVQKYVLVRVLITDELRARGYTCIEAGNADHPRVDLVLTSLRLLNTLNSTSMSYLVTSKCRGR